MIQSISTKKIWMDHLWFDPNVRKTMFSNAARVDLGSILGTNKQSMKELIFDVDADEYTVERMGLSGCKCSSDGSTICIICWNSIFAGLARKLVDEILCKEFGIPLDRILCLFSGRRGFHVHITDLRYLRKTNKERTDIANYVVKNHGIRIDKPVTTNIDHKIRFPLSLHQITKFVVVPVDLRMSKFNECDIFQSPSLTRNTIYNVEHHVKTTLNHVYGNNL